MRIDDLALKSTRWGLALLELQLTGGGAMAERQMLERLEKAAARPARRQLEDRRRAAGTGRGLCGIVAGGHDTRNTNGRKAAGEARLASGITLAQDARSFLHCAGTRWLVGMLELDPRQVGALVGEFPVRVSEQLRLPLGI